MSWDGRAAVDRRRNSTRPRSARSPRSRTTVAANSSRERSSEPEIDEFDVLLDAENAEGKHGGCGVKRDRAQFTGARADGAVLMVIAHQRLRIRREPRDGGIERNKQEIGDAVLPGCDMRGVRHRGEDADRRG